MKASCLCFASYSTSTINIQYFWLVSWRGTGSRTWDTFKQRRRKSNNIFSLFLQESKKNCTPHKSIPYPCTHFSLIIAPHIVGHFVSKCPSPTTSSTQWHRSKGFPPSPGPLSRRFFLLPHSILVHTGIVVLTYPAYTYTSARTHTHTHATSIFIVASGIH
jgi:hypothetical protein